MIDRIILGTAAFGMDYGVTNKRGKVPRDEVERILKLAYDAGIRWLDTAEAYGDAPQICWEHPEFAVINKAGHYRPRGDIALWHAGHSEDGPRWRFDGASIYDTWELDWFLQLPR